MMEDSRPQRIDFTRGTLGIGLSSLQKKESTEDLATERMQLQKLITSSDPPLKIDCDDDIEVEKVQFLNTTKEENKQLSPQAGYNQWASSPANAPDR